MVGSRLPGKVSSGINRRHRQFERMLVFLMTPIQQPITGRENLGDRSQPEQVLAEFYQAFNGQDLAGIEENWAHEADVAMDNPVGGIRRGWSEIRSVYERIFAAAASVQVEFFDYTLHVHGDVFWAIGRERGRFEAPGQTPGHLAIRTTRVFRRIEGRWRQVHHHGSIDEPAMLANYQRAVLQEGVPAG